MLRTTVRGTGKLGSNSNPPPKDAGVKVDHMQIQGTHPSLSSFQVLPKEKLDWVGPRMGGRWKQRGEVGESILE